VIRTRQVIGCHAKHTAGGEKWPYHYPLVKGLACHCYNHFGAICVASCASNILDHEVRHQYATGVITVTCSPGNFVLGCGIRPRYPTPGYEFEKWRTWAVKDVDSCQCYDYFGATCYAMCGRVV